MTYVVAHRGDSLRYRENTLAAIRSAVEAGADRVEIDVVTTRDGVSVVNHDHTLQRLWGDPRAVAAVTWAEVARVGFGDVRIPRLVDVAEALAGSGGGLLVDATNAADAAAAWRGLAHWQARARGRQAADGVALDVHWCGAPEATGAVRELDPTAVIHLESTSGFADPDLVRRQHPTYLNLDGTLLSPASVAAAHAAGLLVAVWTIDDPAAMAAMVALGADSVTTKRPGVMRRLLDDGTLAAMVRTSWGDPRADVGRVDGGDLDAPTLARASVVAGELAAWAAGYLRESAPGSVATKAHAADLVTDVDRAVERRVREVLAAEFPAHLIVGEEDGGTSRPGVPTWYVDPVDGTTNYAHGLGFSSFSLALAIDRRPLIGAVADPWRGEVLLARAGRGATRNGVPLALPRSETPRAGAAPAPGATSLAGTVVLTEWAAHTPFGGQLDLLATLADRYCTTRLMGSGTLSTASVAAGRAAGCVIGEFHPEDHLAATLIAREAGANCRDADGRETAWPRGPFVVAAPAYAAELGALLTRCCRPAPRHRPDPNSAIGEA